VEVDALMGLRSNKRMANATGSATLQQLVEVTRERDELRASVEALLVLNQDLRARTDDAESAVTTLDWQLSEATKEIERLRAAVAEIGAAHVAAQTEVEQVRAALDVEHEIQRQMLERLGIEWTPGEPFYSLVEHEITRWRTGW
jgi:chromosome segregation ATPase